MFAFLISVIFGLLCLGVALLFPVIYYLNVWRIGEEQKLGYFDEPKDYLLESVFSGGVVLLEFWFIEFLLGQTREGSGATRETMILFYLITSLILIAPIVVRLLKQILIRDKNKNDLEVVNNKRKNMPRIFRYAFYLIALGLAWKFYVNVEEIIGFLVGKFI